MEIILFCIAITIGLIGVGVGIKVLSDAGRERKANIKYFQSVSVRLDRLEGQYVWKERKTDQVDADTPMVDMQHRLEEYGIDLQKLKEDIGYKDVKSDKLHVFTNSQISRLSSRVTIIETDKQGKVYMSELLKIEKAFQDDEFIGYRITVGDSTCIIFNDQKTMPGIRAGKGFVPILGRGIVYKPVFLNDMEIGT